jgi:hypothetical protein
VSGEGDRAVLRSVAVDLAVGDEGPLPHELEAVAPTGRQRGIAKAVSVPVPPFSGQEAQLPTLWQRVTVWSAEVRFVQRTVVVDRGPPWVLRHDQSRHHRAVHLSGVG